MTAYAQPDLFSGEVPPPHVRGSVTSAAAADRLEPKSLERQVMDAIAAAPFGLTDNELYDLFPTRRDATVRARRVKLRDEGLVYGDGERLGRTVWKPASKRARI